MKGVALGSKGKNDENCILFTFIVELFTVH